MNPFAISFLLACIPAMILPVAVFLKTDILTHPLWAHWNAENDYTPLEVSLPIKECASAQAQVQAETLVNTYNRQMVALSAAHIHLNRLQKARYISQEERNYYEQTLSSWEQKTSFLKTQYDQINQMAERIYAQAVVDKDMETDARKKQQIEELNTAIMKCSTMTEALTW